MNNHFNALQALDIESPCHENWEAMQGAEATRFCTQCDKHVHHLNALSLPEKTALLNRAQNGESICVRFNSKTLGLQTLLERLFCLRLSAPLLAAVTFAVLLLPMAEAAKQDAPCNVKPKNTRPILMGKMKPPEKPKPPRQSSDNRPNSNEEKEPVEEVPMVKMGLMAWPEVMPPVNKAPETSPEPTKH